MRTAEIEINGKKHLLCFNLWALMEVTERYGGLSEVNKALTEGGQSQTVRETLWLLSTLMKGGDMYAKEMGLEYEKPLSVERMLATCGADFFVGLKSSVIQAMNQGMTTSVEAQDSKNAETTQAN